MAAVQDCLLPVAPSFHSTLMGWWPYRDAWGKSLPPHVTPKSQAPYTGIGRSCAQPAKGGVLGDSIRSRLSAVRSVGSLLPPQDLRGLPSRLHCRHLSA
eukprot:5386258-Amphidinium_carterae.1